MGFIGVNSVANYANTSSGVGQNAIAQAVASASLASDVGGEGVAGLRSLSQIITALFNAGQKGVWFDPSDLSTMYQDSAGTTPVTAVEQPVGLILDKSGNGFSASQATSTKRPTLSARVNKLTYSEDLSNAVWNKLASATVTGTNQVNLAAVASSRVEQAVTSTVGMTWTASFKVSGIGNCRLAIFDNGGAFPSTISSLIVLSSVPTTYTVTRTHSDAAATSVGFRVVNDSSSAATVIVNAAQMDFGSTATRYQRIAAATDYDTSGFPYYLKFDGVDDALQTSSIDFTATNKMTVWAGVRKLSDAAQGMIAELGTGVSVPVTSFSLSHSSGAAANYRSNLYGADSNSNSVTTSPAYSAPNSAVMSAAYDYTNATILTENVFRVNNIVALAVSGLVTTGPAFGNFVLYIGARAGTSLFFNGHLYGLIVRGAQSTAAEIAAAETFTNSKTGAY